MGPLGWVGGVVGHGGRQAVTTVELTNRWSVDPMVALRTK